MPALLFPFIFCFDPLMGDWYIPVLSLYLGMVAGGPTLRLVVVLLFIFSGLWIGFLDVKLRYFLI